MSDISPSNSFEHAAKVEMESCCKQPESLLLSGSRGITGVTGQCTSGRSIFLSRIFQIMCLMASTKSLWITRSCLTTGFTPGIRNTMQNSAAKTPSWSIRTTSFTTWESIDTCISVGFSARCGLLCSTPSVLVFPLGYSEEIPASAVPASDRRYAWSFVGERGKSSRPDMIRAMSSIEPHICYSVTPIRGMTFFDRNSTEKKRIAKQDNYEILGQSVFAPSPMGNANIECCRPYDALEVGAIPILERRPTGLLQGSPGRHPLPTVNSWSHARQLLSVCSKTGQAR